ncbi:Cell division protein FtsI/penicillin-binding protein 2 [Thermomonospora echinospora]|uniref:Cell division protein FtsI/penicillin-binding protein 2 n=1 Tax=Thermomonospora echinospora TaxID=1992 RepID=A0A1H5W5X3_9ACTN|nr:penicillin-binding transpeptidase domain-containing protein [Thermomonospora echinospora]SEF94892.1 Cell division protein FtsI/penicillin-binding protein 2 [Thermomonospora echinospora]
MGLARTGSGGRARRVISVAACGALVAGTTSACFAETSAMPAMRDFLVAWQVGNYEAAARKTVGADQKVVATALAQVRDQLDAASMRLALGLPTAPGEDKPKAIVRKGDQAEARFSVKIDLGENGEPFSYPGQMHLKRVGGKWKVVWSPSLIHPNLRAGQRLAVVTETQPRGDVQDTRGTSLLSKVPADLVGVYPGQLRDPQRTITQLVEATASNGRRLDAERLLGRVRSAPPTTFLPLVTLNRAEHAGLAFRLQRIQGLQVKTVTAPIMPTWAPELVGSLGPATDDRLQRVGAPYQPGDTIGVSGIQLLHQRWLAGTPTVKVVAVDPNGQHREVLAEWGGQAPQTVSTSLDVRQQIRAERALSALPVPASMAVVRAKNGEVLAVANHRTAGQNRAMEGRYPPGFTFGIVSAEALLQSGMSEKDKTECPATATVGGRQFTNRGGARADNTFQYHFGYTCATTLASLSTRIDGATLVREAARFGFGKDWQLSVPAFSGSVPMPANDGEKAEAVIGRGKVLASPLGMALTAGAVSSGLWRPPLLLRAPQDRQTVQPQPLAAVPAGDLGLMMQRGVHSGTAREAKVPGAVPVHGVVDTVQYQEGGRTRTVSWFVGFRGDIAFAIAVEGNVSAAQVAAKFLTG